MNQVKHILYASIWIFSIAAIIAFIPSAGLITLTVPDEQYGSAIALPDTSHLEKRASEAERHATILTDASYRMYPHFVTFERAIPLPNLPVRAHTHLSDTIRGPPTLMTV